MGLNGLMRQAGGAAAILVSLTLPGAAQVVGKAAAVNQDASAAGRVLEIGASVIHKERITTNARGSTQLMFTDQTTLNIGPNSDLVIDEYVFDPNRGVGKMSVSLGKGLMRFVGGQITHNGSATVKTPPATIGIRGGVVDVSTNGKTTTASNSYGTVTITPTGGASVSVPQGSTGATSGGTPSVAPTTQQQASTNNQQFQSKGGQTGGASPTASSTAASYSNSSTSPTSTITTTSAPASGSTAPGPSTTTAAGGGPSFSNPDSPTAIFPNLSGQPPGSTAGAPTIPGGNTPAAPQQNPPGSGGGGGFCKFVCP